MRKDNTIISFFGKKGSGKSFLVKECLEESFRHIIVDNLGEYSAREVYTDLPNAVNRMIQISKTNPKRYSIAFRFQTVEEDLKAIEIASTLSNFLIVIEETSKYVNSHSMPPAIESLIRYGRHSCISQFYLARRPSEINRELTANSDAIITFKQQEPRDVAYLKTFMGEKAFNVPHLGLYEIEVYGDLHKVPLAVLNRI